MMPTAELDKAMQNAASDLDLPAITLVLMKSQGSFEFRLHGGAKAEVREPKSAFLSRNKRGGTFWSNAECEVFGFVPKCRHTRSQLTGECDAV
jgi:hypothetical protein